MAIYSDSNKNSESYCRANEPSFRLPAAKGLGANARDSSIDGGKGCFRSKEFEVY
jgi:hypothetical protein